MLTTIYKFKNFLYSFNKFQWGQILFICSLFPGVFLSDTVRKIFLLLSLYCITKPDVRTSLFFLKDRVAKILPLQLIIFWLWLFFVPLLFGNENLIDRLEGLGWPIEMMLFMFAAFVFAKDSFFVSVLNKFLFVFLSIFLIATITHRAFLSFETNFVNWILGGSAYNIGCMLSWMLPFLLVGFVKTTNQSQKMLILAIFVSTVFVLVLTLFTTFWAVVFVELFVFTIFYFIYERETFRENFGKMIISVCVLLFVFFILFNVSENIVSGFLPQFAQLSSVTDGVEEFTNKRWHIWLEAIEWIKKRPFCGYGWESFAKYSVEQRSHTHSAWTQAAWTAGIPATVMLISFILTCIIYSIKQMHKHKRILMIPLVVLITVCAYLTIGCLDDIFRASRRVTFPYWIIFTLPLTPIFYDIDK